MATTVDFAIISDLDIIGIFLLWLIIGKLHQGIIYNHTTFSRSCLL